MISLSLEFELGLQIRGATGERTTILTLLQNRHCIFFNFYGPSVTVSKKPSVVGQ